MLLSILVDLVATSKFLTFAFFTGLDRVYMKRLELLLLHNVKSLKFL